jgi:hypothetical protein
MGCGRWSRHFGDRGRQSRTMMAQGNGTRRAVALSSPLGRKGGSPTRLASGSGEGRPSHPPISSSKLLGLLDFGSELRGFCSLAETEQQFSCDKFTASAAPFRDLPARAVDQGGGWANSWRSVGLQSLGLRENSSGFFSEREPPRIRAGPGSNSKKAHGTPSISYLRLSVLGSG